MAYTVDGTGPTQADGRGDAGLRWLAGRASSPTPPEDDAWFRARPGRAHRMRAATSSEVAGRPARSWVTLVARHDGATVRICVDEATLPRTDRGEADLARIVRARAAAMMGGAAAGLTSTPARPMPRGVPGGRTHRVTPVAVGDRRTASDGHRPAKVADTRGDGATAGEAPAAGRMAFGTLGREALAAKVAHDVWPCMALPEALDVVRLVQKRHGRLPVRADDIRGICSEATGLDGWKAHAALKAFGLVATRPDGTTTLTGMARRALDPAPENAGTRADALSRAATAPLAYRHLSPGAGEAELAASRYAAMAPMDMASAATLLARTRDLVGRTVDPGT